MSITCPGISSQAWGAIVGTGGAAAGTSGQTGDAGLAREPFLALLREREDVSEDGGEGAVMFRIW